MNYLGQHFLKNKSAIEKIVKALELKEGDTVIEVGPGRGALTLELVKYPVEIIAVEKDRILCRQLSNLATKQLKIIEGDIIQILPNLIAQLPIANCYKLVGNIPYYLTSFLFRIMGELEHKPLIIVFTIQKEVAEKIVAQPPKMNLLAASIQIWAEPEILDILPASDFEPTPKVDSAIIKLETRDTMSTGRQERQETGKWLDNYYKLIKIIFKQPRKTILNNLSDSLSISKEEISHKLSGFDLSGNERPQNLSIELLVKLTSQF